ncbi:hypothetical protein SAMN00777080_0962 [Aquiflexum balticum DSM 16537]|uniref:Outer membrane protein beta-barrel domain-containing protein n=1 Tax=Aquiflexum balticum DSM 16537 TaxID=758820 RepID=A0A1W2H1B7_9BACT|nr:hypothetical protein [Aquiflexum balticum]SMD42412.1 hypothetical protein SAMN00777080_0962 [Aquiflexum balticum DSM 16537]
MKTTLILLLMGLFFGSSLSVPLWAQQQLKPNSGLGLGFQVNQFQNDFGFGLNLTSPEILNGNAAFRLKANQVYFEHLLDGEYVWSGYQNVSLGFVGFGGMVGQSIRLYGEGGLAGIIPSDRFSSESFRLSTYGTFGFEFFPTPAFNYFLELGVMTSRARADKIAGSPFFSNGFVASVGFRLNLKK